MVKSAINVQITYTDFTLGAQLSGSAGKSKADKYLQADELETLIKVAYGRADFSHITAAIIYFGAVTGARYAEILGPTWKDINFTARTVSITKSWDYSHSQTFIPTKTPSSVRTITITAAAVSMLKTIKKQQASFYMRTGRRDPNNLIFVTRLGMPPSNTAINKMMRKLQDETASEFGRPLSAIISFHGLRHSHASYLLSRGIDIYYISKRLGHSDITITMRVYSHLLDRMQSEQDSLAMAAIGELETAAK